MNENKSENISKKEENKPNIDDYSLAMAVKNIIFPLMVDEIKKIFQEKVDDDLMTIEQVCRFFQKNKSTIWRWTKEGLISGSKISGTVYYKKSELYKLIDRNKI